MTDIPTAELDRLEALAEKATPGPWENIEWGVSAPSIEPLTATSRTVVCTMTTDDEGSADAAFIAACDPDTIRRLIAAARPSPEPLERAYTLLISATPALFRAFRDSPNETATRLNAMLHDAVVDWCLDYQKATGRGDQGLARLASTEPSADPA